jgi:hypothetical protein
LTGISLRDGCRLALITARSVAVFGDREFDHAPASCKGSAMPDPQTPTLSPRAAERPRCPKCQSRMVVQRITRARSGFEHWTLRCTRCSHIHEAQVPTDPMSTDARNWLNGGLKSPE